MSDVKACPKCAETIQREAKVCRYCGQKFGFHASVGSVGCLVLIVLGIGFCAQVREVGEDREAAQQAARDATPPLTPDQLAVCGKMIDDLVAARVIVDRDGGSIRVRRSEWAELTGEEQGAIIAGVACAAYREPVGRLSGFDQAVFVKDAATGKIMASAANGMLQIGD